MLPALDVPHGEVGEREQDVWTASHEGALEHELVGHPLVVGVEERDQWVSRLTHSAVASRSRSPVGCAHVADPVAVRRERRLGPIGGSVVHDDHLVAGRARGEGGDDRAADEPRTVVRRDDDADSEIVHPASHAVRTRPDSQRRAERRTTTF